MWLPSCGIGGTWLRDRPNFFWLDSDTVTQGVLAVINKQLLSRQTVLALTHTHTETQRH
jgi:hypothetical protein